MSIARLLLNDSININQIEIGSIQDFDSFSIASGSAQVNNLDIFDELDFTIVRTAGAGADTITLTVSHDGVNFGAGGVLCMDSETSAIHSGTGMVQGEYHTPINCKAIKFTHSGSTDTFTVTWAARNAGRRRME